MLKGIPSELRPHAPFTAFEDLTGIGILGAIVDVEVPPPASRTLFWTLDLLHVLPSAPVTTAIYRSHDVSTCGACAAEHLGVIVPHDHGDRRAHGFPDGGANDRVSVFCGVDPRLHE